MQRNVKEVETELNTTVRNKVSYLLRLFNRSTSYDWIFMYASSFHIIENLRLSLGLVYNNNRMSYHYIALQFSHIRFIAKADFIAML